MKKKQHSNPVFGWIKGKINTKGASLKATEKSVMPKKIQKDSYLDGSLCILRNHAQGLRSLQ